MLDSDAYFYKELNSFKDLTVTKEDLRNMEMAFTKARKKDLEQCISEKMNGDLAKGITKDRDEYLVKYFQNEFGLRVKYDYFDAKEGSVMLYDAGRLSSRWIQSAKKQPEQKEEKKDSGYRIR